MKMTWTLLITGFTYTLCPILAAIAMIEGSAFWAETWLTIMVVACGVAAAHVYRTKVSNAAD